MIPAAQMSRSVTLAASKPTPDPAPDNRPGAGAIGDIQAALLAV
jgi:hypothetical protein